MLSEQLNLACMDVLQVLQTSQFMDLVMYDV